MVEAAEPENSPLHPAFDWDDTAAARKYRLQQARGLIRALITIRDDRTPEHRTFTLTVEDEQSAYAPSVEVARNEDALGEAVAHLRSEVSAAQASVDDLMNLARSMRAGKEVVRRVRRVRSAVHKAAKAAETL